MKQALKAKSPEADYRRGTIITMAIYVLSIILVSVAVNRDMAHGAVLVLLALLPGLAIVGQIFVTVQFLRVSDEYVRAVQSKRLIAACMATLAIFTVWGFLEEFADITGPAAWSAYCVMWALFGFSCLFIKDSK